MEHVFLVAVEVNGDADREKVEKYLHERLPLDREGAPDGDPDGTYVESWWIAEDERYDRSDNDSAVFVIPGKQREARNLLRTAGLAY